MDGFVEIGADDVVRGGVGVGGVAEELVGDGDGRVEVAEGCRGVVTRLCLESGNIDGFA